MKKYMRYIVMLPMLILFSAINVYALTGSWRGELVLGPNKLPLVFNFSMDADGKTQCTLDSPAQGAKGIAVEVTLCTADSVSLTCAAIGASYSGAITSGNITGTFKQRGYSFPLNLSPEIPIEERRPQTPKPPFTYEVKDTVFKAPDGAVMSATLTLPRNAKGKKVPAVVMVTGSGPQNRDEELLEHKPFAVAADYLARNGIASLRYDDRGFGKSGGNFQTSTTETFKNDAKSGVDFLRTIKQIGPIGVLGHSEGGTIAFMLGSEKCPDFIISLAGMAVSGKETLIRQNRRALESLDMQEADKKASLELIEAMFDRMTERTAKGIRTPVDVDSLANVMRLKVPSTVLFSLKMTQNIRTPWFDYFLTLNPGDYIAKVKCPVLAINGEKDTQVYPDNLTVIKDLAPHAHTMLMPGLNHLMQHAVTGEMSEYGEIRETISLDVLETIIQFIKSLGIRK